MRQRRRLANPSADQKKCRFHTMAIEQIEQRRSDGRIRSIVKSERDRGRVARMPDRRSEKLRRRRHGAPRIYSARGAHAPPATPERRNSVDHRWNFRTAAHKTLPNGIEQFHLIRWPRKSPKQWTRHDAAPFRFPVWIRCAAIVWLAIWIPAYWRTWGAANFLHLCDIAVILTCVGILTNSALLISSQAVRRCSSICLDARRGLAALSRTALLGGADYLFDATLSAVGSAASHFFTS